MRVAIVTGATGQDGSYLCELLLEKGYDVYACIRRCSQDNMGLISHIVSKLNVRYVDMNDAISLSNVIREVDARMDVYDRCEIYNLAAQSHVHVSFFVPDYTSECDALGPLRLLECIRQTSHRDKFRMYQASTSELYGDTTGSTMQSEVTPFRPRSPYATAKLYAYWIVRNYRESYGIFVSNGILFNHESPRRGIEFVTRKITRGMTRLFRGDRTTPIEVGNLDSKRDWGHAKDYVRSMWLILQTQTPEDWVIATGEVHSVREVIDIVANTLSIALTWSIEDGLERAVDSEGRIWIQQSQSYMRPNDVTYLCGDATKARSLLGWSPTMSFQQIIEEMVTTDLANN